MDEVATADIAYMVTGSMASGYYGQPRMTRDVDLVVELQSGGPERMEALFSDAFLLSADTARGAMTRAVIVAQGPRLDWSDLEAWAATLGLTAALESLR